MTEAGSAIPAETGAARGGAVIFIFVTILLDTLALGVIIPILPKLVVNFVDNDTASAARIFGVFGTAWALMQFFFSPILGGLSDRFGRRPVVLLSNFGLALDYVLVALAPSLAWLFVGRVISGITSASIPTSFAYRRCHAGRKARRRVRQGRRGVRRRIYPGTRGRRTARRHGSAAAVLGRGGIEFRQYAVRFSDPAGVAAAASPLDLPLEKRQSPGRAASAALGPGAGDVVLPSTFVLYATYRYGWDAATVGLTLAMVGICAMVVQGLAIGPIVQRYGERQALLLGLGCGAAGFLIFGAAPTGALFWLGIPVMAFWGVAGAAAQALMTRLVAPDQQGQLQGANNTVQSVSGLVGPFLFTLTFAYFIGAQAPVNLPGAPFLLAAALLVLALVVAARTLADRAR
jgi:DHA1 family tetracycline resistance protein-like MFS transporter